MWVADEVPVLSRGGVIMTQAAAASHVSILSYTTSWWQVEGGEDRSDYSTLVGVGTCTINIQSQSGGGGGGGTSVV